MTILDIMTRSGIAGSQLIALLSRIGSRFPELATELEIWTEQLGKAIEPGRLVELSVEVVKEVHDIARGKLDPRDHPSDAL